MESNHIVVTGWFRNDNPDGRKVELYLDHKNLGYQLSVQRGAGVRTKYMERNAGVGEELTLQISLPENWQNAGHFLVYSVDGDGKRTLVNQYSVRQLLKIRSSVDCHIESGNLLGDMLTITGWAIAAEHIDYTVVIQGKQRAYEVVRSQRQDIQDMFPECGKEYQAGFQLKVRLRPKENNLKLILRAGNLTSLERINVRKLCQPQNGKTASLLAKTVRYVRRNGIRATLNKVNYRLNYSKGKNLYGLWRQKNALSEMELQNQRNMKYEYMPLISVVVPLYQTKEKFLRELIESITMQTYANWELCLADGSEIETGIEKLICEYQQHDSRIIYKKIGRNKGIAGNTNEAIKLASGDYIALADHDDFLTVNALFECVKMMNECNDVEVLYSDEDKVDMAGKNYFDPHFKSDMNIDLLCSMNYICHLFVFKRDLLVKCGLFNGEYEGAQDYDFILRCVEQAKEVYHIPKILYHWRCHKESTAENPKSKLYAFENGCKVIEDHYKRCGIPATVEIGKTYGLYRTRYHWDAAPLISIIIPNKDHIEDLKKCIDSIVMKSSYRNYEILVVENNSTQQDTFEYYKSLEAMENICVLTYQGEFNYSKINNFGVSKAMGTYILLLNNDTELLYEDSLKDMLDICMREDVGIVGAKLYYENHTIQHAGVIIGMGGMAGHAFIGLPGDCNGYYSRIDCVQDYSAVTAACLMTKKSIYCEVGGLSEEYRVAFNDIDYCLKVRKLGKLVVYNPYAQLMHYESKSRGLEDSPEKVARFNKEATELCNKWKQIMDEGDPYYNKNLTLNKSDFSIKEM